MDGENVRRSRWPNVRRDELETLAADWAAANGHEARVIWEGETSADDRIVELAPRVGRYWLVTSDRELRERAGAAAERVIGGGAFLRLLGSE